MNERQKAGILFIVGGITLIVVGGLVVWLATCP